MPINELLTVTFTLFAVIDIIGSVPILISLKEKMGGINELRATLISGGFMVLFLFMGEPLLGILGLDTRVCGVKIIECNKKIVRSGRNDCCAKVFWRNFAGHCRKNICQQCTGIDLG